MPESGAKSHLVNNGKAMQSAWLTHWTRNKPETGKHDHLTQTSSSEGNDLYEHDFKNHTSGVETASDNFGISKEINDVDLTMSLIKPSSQSFPFFKRSQESGKLKERVQPLLPQVASDFNLETSRECQQVKYHMFFGESSYKLDTHTTHEPENVCHLAAAFAPKPKSEMPSFPRQTTLFKTDPSSSSHHSPTLIEEQYKRMQKHLGMGFFPRQTGPPQQNVPHFVQDVEMTRMPGGALNSFSRTTHSLLITQQTDVKVYQESQFFRESRASTQLKGEVFKELNYSQPHFGQSQQGVKLQLLDSSDHDSRDVQKNESSADTDTMDMESYKENNLSGVHLSTPKKNIILESNIEKDNRRKRKIELPDMNIEVSAQPAASSSTEKATSRTQSLDMNTLHFNRDQTTNSNSNSNSNSNECSNSNPGSDPGSRWIKRLKLTDTSSHGRVSRFFTTVRVMEGKPKPEPEPVLKSLTGEKVSESSLVEGNRDCKETTLSHSWIQRWSHKQNQKNLGSAGTCQVDNSKSEMEELEKKQFPSIAAMALMGKAMTGFRQFKLRKKESFVVWNTKAFD